MFKAFPDIRKKIFPANPFLGRFSAQLYRGLAKNSIFKFRFSF